MSNDPIKSLPWLQHGDVQITPKAVDAAIAFDPNDNLTREGAAMLIGMALHNFIESYSECPFFFRYSRHSVVAMSQSDSHMDLGSVLILHAIRTIRGWYIGTPAEFPLPDGYEQERVIQESQLLDRMARGQ